MGLFGGSKSSTSVDQSQTTYETNDQSFIQAGQAGVRGDGNITTVNNLDGGAINGAFNYAGAVSDKVFNYAGAVSDKVFNYAGAVNDKTFSFANARGEDETERYAMMIDAQKSGAQVAAELAKRALDVAKQSAETAQNNVVQAYGQANDKPVPINMNLIIGAVCVVAVLLMVK